MRVEKIDFANSEQAETCTRLLNIYAQDIMGGGKSLADNVLKNLPVELAARSFAHAFIVYHNQKAIGLALCMEGFSTFSCKPLINIHDFMVIPEYRNQGVAKILLHAVEEFARSIQCCKLTLEVLQGNAAAQRAYEKFGFTGYELNPEQGKALFWEKALN